LREATSRGELDPGLAQTFYAGTEGEIDTMKNLRIGTVADRSGFSTHVLRVWESRYGLLDPTRSEGGQRLYSEDDVDVLARVKELLDAGYRIGEIARIDRSKLLEDGRRRHVESSEMIRAADSSAPEPDSDLSRALLDDLPCGVVFTDVEGRTRWLNRGFSELCGYSLTALYGKTPGSVLQGPATDRATVERIRSALREHRPCSERILNYHKDGHLYWADLDIAPVGVGGAERGFVAVAREPVRRSTPTLAEQVADAASAPQDVTAAEAANELLGRATRTLAVLADRAPEERAPVFMALADLVSSLGKDRS
jgi:PAS domain S-box-containing protein